MRFKFFVLLIIVLSLSSCSDNDKIMELNEGKTNLNEGDCLYTEINAHVLATHFGGYDKNRSYTRAGEEYTITPYIENGDTLYYIAQYVDGWELYSACKSLNRIILSSEHGVFSASNNNSDGIKNIIDNYVKYKRNIEKYEISDIHPSWWSSAITERDLEEGEITELKKDGSRIQVNNSDLPPGEWVLMEMEVLENDKYTSPKLTKTKWGQKSPWNQCCPMYSYTNGKSGHCPAGCVTVALAQYLYYTHYKDNVPLYSVDSAKKPSIEGYEYDFSGQSSIVWNKMAVDSTKNGTYETSLLLGDVGKKLHSIYSPGVTTATSENVNSLLKATYGLNFSYEPFDYDKIAKSIDNGYPVLGSVVATESSTGSSIPNVGHYLLIDQHKYSKYSIRYFYVLKRSPLPPGVVDRWMSDLVDENGNVISWAYTNEIINTNNEFSISMNWGFDGEFDDVFYYPDGKWIIDDINFNSMRYIHLRPDSK